MPIDDTWLARARSFLAKKQSMWANHDLLNAQIVDMFPEALAEIERLRDEIKELEVLRSDLTEDLRKQEKISAQLREALVEERAKQFGDGHCDHRTQYDIVICSRDVVMDIPQCGRNAQKKTNKGKKLSTIFPSNIRIWGPGKRRPRDD